MIIYIQEGQRRIPIQYASRVRGRRMYSGGQTFLPLRVNQAGVIPIIFAVSILLFPHQLATYFSTSNIPIVKQISEFIVILFSTTSPFYIVTYFLLTMGFTYFYTAFTFKPDETAEQLRKNGGFIPGIRPGRPTQDYLARVVTRITFAGALFLAIVAVSPSILALGFPDLGALGLGGTSLLIVVSVVVETMKQIEAQLMMRTTRASSGDAPRSTNSASWRVGRRRARTDRQCRRFAIPSGSACALGAPGQARGPRRRSSRNASECPCLRRATCCAPRSRPGRRSGARPTAS